MGLLSHTTAMAIGTLNLKNGVVAIIPAICIGMGIEPQNHPTAIPRTILRLLVPKYPFGSLYFSRNALILSAVLPFGPLSVFRIMTLPVL